MCERDWVGEAPKGETLYMTFNRRPLLGFIFAFQSSTCYYTMVQIVGPRLVLFTACFSILWPGPGRKGKSKVWILVIYHWFLYSLAVVADVWIE